ncbi:hypothetical protein HCZ30_05180 [Marivivens donghaensis]|uniref:Uncharacterized protein n=1 Tax=Marivivens donghaensis TaxID=1699413 RepID=A0ABX0VUT9_9RHOB|nr:hypothetical protein [Marivivens donghaensis]NIY71826.1 hypothetical protein [Marivivens donghaensis]
MTDLSTRITKLIKLERELPQKAGKILQPDSPMYLTVWFILGASQRTLAQSRGFRSMIEAKNFPSAAILLRTQIDTAMRINGLKYLHSTESQLSEVFKGTKNFRQLLSRQKTVKGHAVPMYDKKMLEWLMADEPWIEPIYHSTSDFVHLSFRPLIASIQELDDDTGDINFAITGEDIVTGEHDYYEICDAFFDVTKLTCTLILAALMAIHHPNNEPTKS